MNTITSRDEFKNLILMRLGSPVIEINVSPEQVEARIEEAINRFCTYSFNGSERIYLKHVVTPDEIAHEAIDLSVSNMMGQLSCSPTSKTVTGVATNFFLDVFVGEIIACPHTGMITTTARSPIVTGYGTLFTTELTVGDSIILRDGNNIGVVASIQSNTSLTLQTNALHVVEDVDLKCYVGTVVSIETNTSLTLKVRAKKTLVNATGCMSLRGNKILSVLQMFPIGTISSGLLTSRFTILASEIIGMGSGQSIINFSMTKQFLSTLAFQLEGIKNIEYSSATSVVHISINWSEQILPNSFIILECFARVNPDTSGIYNDEILQKYATALVKQNWGANLSKFGGIVLLGNVTLNGSDLKAEANAELKEIEIRIRDEFSFPPIPIIG